MKHFRWFEVATLCTAVFMGFALNSCSDEENGMLPNDDFAEVQSALTTAKITKGAVSIRKGPGVWYERIGGLRYGKTVEVVKEQGGWINIKSGNVEGWIYRPDTDFASTTSAASCSQEIANFIRDNNPNGYNIIFAYDGSDQAAEFHSQANSFSKEYHTLNVASGALGKDIYRKIKTYPQLKSGIQETGRAVVKCLEEHPREGFDDSKCSQIKNLTIMTHGFTTGLNFGGGYFKNENIKDFGSTVYGYLNSKALRVQLYACSTARNSSTKENWNERYTGNVIKEQDPFTGGKGSFAQLLSEEMGPDATVFGHTTAGHLSGNYAARCYGKMANGAVHGKHMFDVYFPQSFVAEQAKRIGKSEDTTRTSMYSYYRSTGAFPGNNSGRDTFMDPEGKGKKMRDAWLSKNP
ncbi:MAG: SH3 domain-containing protein [Proteobacteria bacterium]|nr:SH3 domain-containing protein [Pseudomonadota bacterium]